VRIVFYGSVVCFALWMMSSVVYQLMAERGPLRKGHRISKQLDKPQEIFRCYFDTLLLFNALMADFGRIPADTRCRENSVKARWTQVYAWDTHPWTVVHQGNRDTISSVGVWRYRRWEVWSRCRLGDDDIRQRSPALAHLAKVHRALDDLRRALTRQVKEFQKDASPLVTQIRKNLDAARERLHRPKRRLKRERKLSKYRLRKWGIREPDETVCPVGF